ncbi:CDP-alcohol phosphatidyltransferase family protein [Salinicola sp. JS01]|uniref:CDP-alcohol phosphatidyltransferase family protein n=1 Tax=Salinicola sp. JS01 TaxID=3050071 RepID=UPI00255B7277|nr:CDP-alcohol phosphatidyltransferase family protein [Salinicola sp. JS01]WIX32601.1 CDP-alcohol phosphatidyltransferase family protein [Salinicola sp. JS01]
MLDRLANRHLEVPLRHLAKRMIGLGARADHVTLVGFCLGMLALPALASEHYGLALLFIVLNRVADGLDGAIARLTGPSAAGGFLDITLDFFFYASIPLGFILADPSHNALAGSLLMFSFVGTGTSFLATAIFAERHGIQDMSAGKKAFHYSNGLMEGTETQIFFVAMCLLPAYFPGLALTFATLCMATSVLRVYATFRTLKASS